eukprot:936432-Karenia_brevis.AAC.1
MQGQHVDFENQLKRYRQYRCDQSSCVALYDIDLPHVPAFEDVISLFKSMIAHKGVGEDCLGSEGPHSQPYMFA